MPSFLTRLVAESVIRLNKRAYHVAEEARSIAFIFPEAKVAVVDRFIQVSDERVPNGFLVQVMAEAANIREATQKAAGWAVAALSLVSLGGRGAVSRTRPLWSYDVTSGITARDWRCLYYDPVLDFAKRRIDVPGLGEFWKKLDAFMSYMETKDDWKARVWRGIHAHRRSLSDNDDSLSEFIILWTAFEGLDCVYRKVFPARQGEFKDGMKAVLAAVDPGADFGKLEGLRDGIAHGAMDLNAATQTAKAHVDLTRNALQYTVMRVLGFDEPTTKAALARASVSGRFAPHFCLIGTLECEPVPFDNFQDQPDVEPLVREVKTSRDGDKLNVTPDLSYRFLGPNAKLTPKGYEIWGDKELPLTANESAQVSLTKGTTGE